MLKVEKEIRIIIRVVHTMEEIDVSLPIDATAEDIIDTLLESDLGIEKIDSQGNHISYRLVPKGKNSAIQEGQTLTKAGIQEGDILLMTPSVIAGNSDCITA